MQGREILCTSMTLFYISALHRLTRAQDNKCQKAAWSTHKAICKKRREVLAVVGRRPESLELYNAMRDFLRKHRVALMILGPCSVLHFYAPPYTSDPATAVQTREDVLYIYLRQRPNAESARPETLFIVTDVQLETMDGIPADQREELRIGMNNCKEGAMRQEGPCGAMLVVMYYPDVAGPITCDSSRGFMVVFPIVFPSDQTCHTVTQWKRYLLHLLNGGVLL